MGRHTFWSFFFLACLAVISLVEGSPKVRGRSKCPEGAIYYRLQCYHPIYRSLTWDEAEIECQYLRHGGHLATFRSAAEEKIVSSHIRRIDPTTEAWIGMHAVRTGKILNWQWSDGGTYTIGDTLWDNRMPGAAKCDNECISVTNIHNPGNTVRWAQRKCTDVLPFICKYRASF